ncbi:MAG: phosphomethylpyrimidine synthase ThiC, partial [Desulfobacteraceae bacterium]
AGDLAKGIKDAQIMDNQMSRARGELDWEGQFACAIDPEKAREYRKSSQSCEKNVCTMCGDFCAVKRAKALL